MRRQTQTVDSYRQIATRHILLRREESHCWAQGTSSLLLQSTFTPLKPSALPLLLNTDLYSVCCCMYTELLLIYRTQSIVSNSIKVILIRCRLGGHAPVTRSTFTWSHRKDTTHQTRNIKQRHDPKIIRWKSSPYPWKQGRLHLMEPEDGSTSDTGRYQPDWFVRFLSIYR